MFGKMEMQSARVRKWGQVNSNEWTSLVYLTSNFEYRPGKQPVILSQQNLVDEPEGI
jgi:hypothetical protein